MVKVCTYNYPKSNEESYKKYYENYPYELHDFQKWCVEGIVTGNHVLACCPTGSGKTFGGEFAIQYFHEKRKKVIYTSPIKALSNEKFYNFTNKYTNISIGLITGDIKTNPDADVLIMTTEILLNKLYQIKSSTSTINSSVSFDMDIENELGCVVFDEIHFINEESRGHVWESCIMLLPTQVQMIGLSATLDDPEKFAFWLETKGDISKPIEKEVYLTRKQIRAVPLIHYGFITTTQTAFKRIRDKTIQEEIKKLIDKPIIVQDEKNKFNDINYNNIVKTLKLFEQNDIRVKRQHILNNLSQYLVEHEMLPALCYVFSRKQLEICAQELTTNLLEFDSKVPYIVDRECEQIIRKLPNYKEYLHLPEYINTVKLLRKGVGIHHAGLIPILREMTELLFTRGFIKILFCTETMSVGINLPVRTTIFTDVNKFNGENIRMLYSHEYTQAAGRAGRLGLDKVGHVIHLNNLFKNVDSVSYKKMMSGKPQTLISKFKISYNLILNLLDIGDNNLTQFASRSMITGDLDNEMKEIYYKMLRLQTELDNINNCMSNIRTPIEVIKEYNELLINKNLVVNKKRKEIERKIEYILSSYKFLNQDLQNYNKISEKEKEINNLKTHYEFLNKYFESGVETVLNLLKEDEFIEQHNMNLTLKGKIASQIREIHCLVFSNLYENKKITMLNSKQLVALFSCFTNIRVLDSFKDNNPSSEDALINDLLLDIVKIYNEYQDKELKRKINNGFDYEIHYDLLNYIEKWCDSENIEDCKLVLQEIDSKKGIFLGEFVKALLKINNISSEFERIAEFTGNIEFLSKLREIPNMTLKYVVTNQSLYV
jgi:superfamily II RNA helicase